MLLIRPMLTFAIFAAFLAALAIMGDELCTLSACNGLPFLLHAFWGLPFLWIFFFRRRFRQGSDLTVTTRLGVFLGLAYAIEIFLIYGPFAMRVQFGMPI